MMDPIGFGFENYDSIGRFATIDPNGLPIDSSGEFKYTRDSDGAFDGALELVERLVESDEVAECMTTQIFRYAHGRRADDADACAVHALMGQRESSFKDLLVAVTLTDGFRYRQRDTGE